MSYATYTTEALVCGSYVSNTSDKSYLLFTKEAGMLFASARSVREERSKQRYALQELSYIRVSLVKGKSGWRIGSVEALGNPFMQAPSRRVRSCVVFVINQLRRYVHGEVPLQVIYDDAQALLSLQDVSEDELITYERLFQLRLLTYLGYIAPEETWKPLIEAETLPQAYVLYVPTYTASIESAITKGTQASQL